jgi:hypothetical protein
MVRLPGAEAPHYRPGLKPRFFLASFGTTEQAAEKLVNMLFVPSAEADSDGK